jgi:hypothetical protein
VIATTAQGLDQALVSTSSSTPAAFPVLELRPGLVPRRYARLTRYGKLRLSDLRRFNLMPFYATCGNGRLFRPGAGCRSQAGIEKLPAFRIEATSSHRRERCDTRLVFHRQRVGKSRRTSSLPRTRRRCKKFCAIPGMQLPFATGTTRGTRHLIRASPDAGNAHRIVLRSIPEDTLAIVANFHRSQSMPRVNHDPPRCSCLRCRLTPGDAQAQPSQNAAARANVRRTQSPPAQGE